MYDRTLGMMDYGGTGNPTGLLHKVPNHLAPNDLDPVETHTVHGHDGDVDRARRTA